MAVEPAHNQPPRGINGGGRASAEGGEVPQAPEVDSAPEDERQQRGGLRYAPLRLRPQTTRREAKRPIDRDRARHDYGEQQILKEEIHFLLIPAA